MIDRRYNRDGSPSTVPEDSSPQQPAETPSKSSKKRYIRQSERLHSEDTRGPSTDKADDTEEG